MEGRKWRTTQGRSDSETDAGQRCVRVKKLALVHSELLDEKDKQIARNRGRESQRWVCPWEGLVKLVDGMGEQMSERKGQKDSA